ncbi:MAG: hypothetical protein IPN29_08770 [Saprospiraceae bacterium]|nr:hypothetical protein [Saprospiraceae bacterium]
MKINLRRSSIISNFQSAKHLKRQYKVSLKIILIGLVCLNSNPFTLFAQSVCGNELPSNYNMVEDCNYPSSDVSLIVPVYFHEVYSEVTANSTLTPEGLQILLDKVNQEFNGYGFNINFVLAKFDEKGYCFSGLKRHNYDTGSIYHEISGSQIADIYPNQQERDFVLNHYLNVWVPVFLYSGTPAMYNSIGGVGVFPSEIMAFPAGLNGNNFFIKRDEFNFGSFCHEMGHNLGLFHVFEGGGCSALNDCDHGDRIISIPSCQKLNIGNIEDCDGHKVCNGSVDYPVENFMTYADPCRSDFNEEQYKRMAKYIDYFQPLASTTNLAIVLAGSSSAALTNPFTFTQSYSNQRFETSANSIVYIDGNIEFNTCDIFLGPSSELIVKSGSALTLTNSRLSSLECSVLLWQGITVEEGAELILKDNTLIENAYEGIHAKATSSLSLENSLIRDCFTGIRLNDKATPPNLPLSLDIDILKFSGIQIIGSLSLLDHIEHSTSEGSFAGIQIDDVTLVPVVPASGNINSIEGFKYGILSKGSALLIANMDLMKNGWGIKSSSYFKQYYPIILMDIDIFDCTNGVDLDQANIFIDHINFGSNEIGLKLNRCYGSEVINCNQQLLRIPNVGFKILNSSHITFDNDDIFGEQDNIFSNCHNLEVINGNIEPLTLNAVRRSSFRENTFTHNDDGRKNIIMGGDDNQFECNYFSSYVGDAMINDNSPDNMYRCNEFEGYAAGMVFEGNSMGTDFEANAFNSSNIGLYLKGSDVIIGIQTDKGNLYSGVYNEIGALNDNQQYDNSLFINNDQTLYNPAHTPPEWFDNTSNFAQAVCGSNCINGPGDNLISWVGEQYSKCLDSLFYGTKFNSLSTKGKWNLLFILYRKHYLRDTTLLNNRECLKSIIRYFGNSSLHKAVLAYDVLISPQPVSDQYLRGVVIDLVDGYNRDEINSLDIDIFKEIAATFLADNKYNLDSYFQIVDSFGNNFTPFLSEEDPILKVGVVFPILYKYLNEEPISSSEISELISTAESCARDVGPSKYYAISILHSLDIEFQNTNCIIDSNPRKSKKEYLLPVPALKFQLMDIGGRTILNSIEELDISTLQIPFGLYILSTRYEDGTVKGKVVVKL